MRGFYLEAATTENRAIDRCASVRSAATSGCSHVVVDVTIDVRQPELLFVQTCVISGCSPRLELFVCGEGVDPAPQVSLFRKEFTNSFVASDGGAAGCQD